MQSGSAISSNSQSSHQRPRAHRSVTIGAAALLTLPLVAGAHTGHGEHAHTKHECCAHAESSAIHIVNVSASVESPTDPRLETVKAALGLRDATIQQISRDLPNPETGEVDVRVDLGGEMYTLRVAPYSIRSDSFRVLIDDGSGAPPRSLDRELPITTYRGEIEGLADSAVVASFTDDRTVLSACLEIMRPHETTFRVQPLSDAIPGADADLFVVYRDADVLADDEHHCGVDHTHEVSASDPVASEFSPIDRGPGCTKFAEVAFDTDFEYFSTFLTRLDPIAACAADVETVMNETDFVFQRDITVATRINTILLRTSVNDPYNDDTDSGSVLTQARSIWQGIPQSSQPRDFIHLMTGKELDGSTIGLAYVGVICSSSSAIGLSQTLFSTTLHRRVLLTAHEMGHQWNAPHDNQSGSACESTPSGFIMNPSIGSQPLQFSDCSIGRMTTYRTNSTSCVPTPTSAPFVRADSARIFSGQTVDIDVLRNDASNCGDITFALPTTTTPHGSLSTIIGTGSRGRNIIRYTPAAGFAGVDTFNYTATNTAGNSTGTATVTVVAPRAPENPPTTLSGLNVSYFMLPAGLTALPNFNNLSAALQTTATTLNFPSTTGNFSTSGRADNVGAIYTGYINITTIGQYTFFAESDEGSRLYIGDTLVVDNDGAHAMQEASGSIGLGIGKHAFRVEYFENTDAAGLIVRFQGPSISKQVIGSSRFSRTAPCAADFNGNREITADDIFFFLDAWFVQQGQSAGNLSADFNRSGVVTADDIFAFLDSWFRPCP